MLSKGIASPYLSRKLRLACKKRCPAVSVRPAFLCFHNNTRQALASLLKPVPNYLTTQRITIDCSLDLNIDLCQCLRRDPFANPYGCAAGLSSMHT